MIHSKKKIRAFSLIELSIVILVIGVLIAGVTQGSKLVRKFKVQTARTLTQSSPVASIKDLVMWYETSTPESFISTQAVDGGTISTWRNINPHIASSAVLDATQTDNADYQPTYVENEANGLPVLRFDGTNDYLDFNGDVLEGQNFSIFVVAARRDSDEYNFFVGGSSGYMYFGFRDDNQIVFIPPAGGSFGSTRERTDEGDLLMHSLTFEHGAAGIAASKYWLNGGLNADGANTTSAIGALESYMNPRIARTFGLHSKLDFAELIIFTRNLKTQERQDVEAYLSQKYAIAIEE